MKDIKIDVKKHILPNIPYVAFFLAFWYIHGKYSILPYPDWLVGIVVAAIIRAIVYFKGKNAKKYRKDVEYGSARWGKPDDIKPYVAPDPKDNLILTATESLTMNPRPPSPKYARNKNVLIVGGSGSGKTRFWLKPNLMQCQSEKHPVSFVVTDPKVLVL